MIIARCCKCGDGAQSALVLVFKRGAWGDRPADDNFLAYTSLWPACTKHEPAMRAQLEVLRDSRDATSMPSVEWRIDQYQFDDVQLERERARCHDCRAFEGQLHVPGCDMERCPFCGGQVISCECANRHFYPGATRDFSQPQDRFTKVDREHGRNCQAPDWSCTTCTEIEKKGTFGLPARVYFQGLRDEQQDEWDRLLAEKGRIPWILYPTVCCKCGELWPEMFNVEDAEWERYVPPAMRGKILCRDCYDWIRRIVDEAAAKRSA